jgi:hypothetical protein
MGEKNMKSLETILNQTPVFLNDWKSLLDLWGDFDDIYMDEEEYRAGKSPYPNEESWVEKRAKMDAAIKEHEAEHVLFASYCYENYSGNAWVLFEKDGQLYEVNGGHCSCYGLEGQWEPEAVTLDALEHRVIEGKMGKGDCSGNEFADELREFLGIAKDAK